MPIQAVEMAGVAKKRKGSAFSMLTGGCIGNSCIGRDHALSISFQGYTSFLSRGTACN